MQTSRNLERQSGGITIFTGIFVLILMTLMLLYASRVGLFEQRVSSNEMRQKIAFHNADRLLWIRALNTYWQMPGDFLE